MTTTIHIRQAPPLGSTATLVVAVAALVLATLPMFLVGGLAGQLRDDFGLSTAGIGGVVTAGFATAALAAPLLGRVTDRFGPKRAILAGCTCSTTALVGVALFATHWTHVAGLLMLAGTGFAFTDPGLAVLVTETVDEHRRGLAFGVKEAAIPGATLAVGLAIPTLAITIGWRWAFAVAVIPLAIVGGMLPRIGRWHPGTATQTTSTPRGFHGVVLLIAAAAALGSAAASGIGVFLVESATNAGIGGGRAGLLLAAGSVAGIVTRVAVGHIVDRRGSAQLALMASMLAIGGMAMALASLGSVPLLVVGSIGAFAGGWGWTGLMFLSLVQMTPTMPGAIAGIGMAGLGLGNTVGPLAFGALAESGSYAMAWAAAAAACTLAATLTWLAHHHHRQRGMHVPPGPVPTGT